MKYMLKFSGYLLAILVLFSFLSTSCRKEPHFDNIPSIEFRRVEERIYVDESSLAKIHELSIVIYFQDGDGDLGLSTTLPIDNSPPFDINSEFKNNFIMNLLIKEQQPDGSFEFVPYLFPNTNRSDDLSGRFPRISSDGRPEPLEGEIKYTERGITSDIENLVGKTVKFEVFIYDRALNKSNTVVTNEITLFP